MSEAEILETLLARFDQLDSKFEQIDKRFEQIDERFDRIDERFEQIDERFEQVDKRFEQVDKRFDKVFNIFEEQNVELYNIKAILKNHDNRFSEMDYNIKKIHNQTVRLSIGQSELDLKIDKLNNLNSDKNINSL